jgi:hypothetical protein
MKIITLLSCISFCGFTLLSSISQATESKKTLDNIVKDTPHAIEPISGRRDTQLTVYNAEKDNNFGVSLKIATGVLNHNFKQKNNATFDNGKGTITQVPSSIFVLKDTLPFIGLSMTTRWNQWSAEVYVQKTAEGQSQEISDIGYLNSSFHDSDYSIAIGYDVLENLSLSAGYKMTISAITIREAMPSTEVGKVAIPQITGLQEFTTYGPSLGIAYNWRLNADTSIAISTAYGWLKGKRQSVGTESSLPQPTQGISLGISFNHRIPRTHIKYSISLDHYQYSMKATSSFPIANTTITVNQVFDITQALDTFRATLIYEF